MGLVDGVDDDGGDLSQGLPVRPERGAQGAGVKDVLGWKVEGPRELGDNFGGITVGGHDRRIDLPQCWSQVIRDCRHLFRVCSTELRVAEGDHAREHR